MKNPLPWLVTDCWSQYLALFGMIAAFKLVKVIWFHVAWTLKTYLPGFYRPYDYPRRVFGEWAAISGCTSGIGLSIVKEIARRGINLILISRSEEKLRLLAKDLEMDFKIKTKIIINDAESGESTMKMAKELAELDIGILVNNVGINLENDQMKPFHDIQSKWVFNTLLVNTVNYAMTMKYVLPNMIKARKGVIINICSSSSYSPVPLQNLYASTKVFMDTLTRGINQEVAPSGVHVQSFCPFFVQSNMTQFSNFVHSFLSISGESYAKSCINKIGTCKRTGGHWYFDLIYGIGLITFQRTGLMHVLYHAGDIISNYKL